MSAAPDYTATIHVARKPADVFRAITDVRRWWTGDIDGEATRLGDEFSYRYRGFHDSTQQLVELIPDRKLTWRITASNLVGYDDPHEWTNTEISFDLAETGGGTTVHFTHRGLTPAVECYENCSAGWGFYIFNSLHRWLTTDEGPTTPPWAEEATS